MADAGDMLVFDENPHSSGHVRAIAARSPESQFSRRQMIKPLFIALFACTFCLPSFAGEAAPTFARKPVARIEDGKTVVEFAADQPTDCAVSVLGADGTVARHLAAGRLGPNAPEPLQKNSLAQKLVWDGRDDFGKPVPGGPFKVRVSLGLRPIYDGLIGHEPAELGSVRGLATGPRGEVYVLHVYGALHPNDGSVACSVFDRDGKYLRTILPYPANLPEEKVKGVKHVPLKDGSKVPFLYQGETRSLLPGAGDLPPQRAVATADGRVAFVGVQEWITSALRYAQAGVAQLIVLGADGSTPADGVLKTVLSPMSGSGASLALSPDGRTLYAAGLREGSPGKPTHAVFTFGWEDRTPHIFAGKKGEAGTDNEHFNDPKSAATDAQGNVYVADKGNNRVVVLRPDGAFAGALAVEKPERVEVHPRTGAVYVLGGELVDQLAKFDSWQSAQPTAKTTLPHFKHPNYTVVMALDTSAEPPVLWCGSPYGYFARFSLLRIEDKGTAFGKPLNAGARTGAVGIGAVTDISLDRATDRLFVSSGKEKGLLFDGPSGKLLPVKPPMLTGSGVVASMGGDGNFYVYHSYPDASVSRFGPAMQPLPFGDAKRIDGIGSPRIRGRGLMADQQGNLYVLRQKPQEKRLPGDATDTNVLSVYDREGRLRNEMLVDSEIRSLSSVRVDTAGNIYLAVGVRPAGTRMPDDFAALEPRKAKRGGINSIELDWYTLMYGCIVKFGPGGGEIRSGIGGTPVEYGYDNKTEIKGAQWMHYGASNVPSWRTPGTPDICLCESPRFDVDGFGRCFFPDACRFRVGVLDAAGNEICTFGTYGNQDSAGPQSAMPSPPIAFWWPHAVAAGERFAYVGDRLNRRVVRVKLGYAAEEICEAR